MVLLRKHYGIVINFIGGYADKHEILQNGEWKSVEAAENN